jgi:hypothetical protein
MKYPQVIFFRNKKYSYIDKIFEDKNILQCSVNIISEKEELNKLFDPNYQVFVTFGLNESEYTDDVYSILGNRISNMWFHLKNIRSIEDFNSSVNYCFINNAIDNRGSSRPIFSIFTSCYNTYNKIFRVYNSLKSQRLNDWEWVIMDDSPNLDDAHFNFLRENLSSDKRIRLYRRSENSGSIGNVKNECVSLCRGKYVLELDHDDEILPDVLSDSVNIFEKDESIGFIYMDFINIYENGNNFSYGDFICKGYGGYYCQRYENKSGTNKWVNVYNTPNINNITLSHLVCMPNHPRIWRREMLNSMDNYSEYLPICDDYEILLRTAIHTRYKMVKLAKLGYIQYMNNNNNNFSLIRNQDINRIGPNNIMPQFFAKYKVQNFMKGLNAYEDESYIMYHSQIWKRDLSSYTHNYCNKIINLDFDKQYCIIGIEALENNIDLIQELYKDERNDFILLDNNYDPVSLCTLIDMKPEYKQFTRMKCYSIKGETYENLEKYFLLIYKSTHSYEFMKSKMNNKLNITLSYNTDFNERHSIINVKTNEEDVYLEIGLEHGYTFNRVHFDINNKVGVDPYPKFEYGENETIIKMSSDDYFTDCDDKFDVVFIDGMHQCEYVLRDINNSIKCLKPNGKKLIFIDDILPLNYREQLKIPIKHYYENCILKYGEPWTGDVWKIMYYLLKNYNDKIRFNFWNNPNYRGVGLIQVLDDFQIDNNETIINIINNYSYYCDFEDYLKLILSLSSHSSSVSI